MWYISVFLSDLNLIDFCSNWVCHFLAVPCLCRILIDYQFCHNMNGLMCVEFGRQYFLYFLSCTYVQNNFGYFPFNNSIWKKYKYICFVFWIVSGIFISIFVCFLSELCTGCLLHNFNIGTLWNLILYWIICFLGLYQK